MDRRKASRWVGALTLSLASGAFADPVPARDPLMVQVNALTERSACLQLSASCLTGATVLGPTFFLNPSRESSSGFFLRPRLFALGQVGVLQPELHSTMPPWTAALELGADVGYAWAMGPLRIGPVLSASSGPGLRSASSTQILVTDFSVDFLRITATF
jgi:hypothetical protein